MKSERSIDLNDNRNKSITGKIEVITLKPDAHYADNDYND